MRDTVTPVLHMLQMQRSTDSTVNPLVFVPAGTAGGQPVLPDGSRAKLCPFCPRGSRAARKGLTIQQGDRPLRLLLDRTLRGPKGLL